MNTTGMFHMPETQQTPTTKLWFCTNCHASCWVEKDLVACACGVCGLGGTNLICMDDQEEAAHGQIQVA